jgi:lysyl-tRNA synthetase class 2
MNQAIYEVTGVDFNTITDFKNAKSIAQQHQVVLEPYFNSIGHIMGAFFETFVEKTLINPTFVYDFPSIISPLAKKKYNNDVLAERFELFINGNEYANAYSENNDPQ